MHNEILTSHYRNLTCSKMDENEGQPGNEIRPIMKKCNIPPIYKSLKKRILSTY